MPKTSPVDRQTSDGRTIHRWSRGDSDTRRRLRERGDGDIDTSAGSYPGRWQAFHLAVELATHADDAFVPVSQADQDARCNWPARFSCFSLLEAKPHRAVELADGRTRVSGEGVDVELDDDDFEEAVAGCADAERVGDDVWRLLSTMP